MQSGICLMGNLESLDAEYEFTKNPYDVVCAYWICFHCWGYWDNRGRSNTVCTRKQQRFFMFIAQIISVLVAILMVGVIGFAKLDFSISNENYG